MSKLSIVVPVYNEETVIEAFLCEADRYSSRILELIIVDDGSDDDTLGILRRSVGAVGVTVKVVSLLNNCGKDRAVKEGLRYARGDVVAVMDADLQCSFEGLFSLADHLEARGRDVVIGLKNNYNTLWNVLFRVFSRITGTQRLASNISDFIVARRGILDSAMRRYADGHVFSLKGVVCDVSRKTDFVPIVIGKRKAGTTKMSFGRLVDVFTATFLLAFPNLARVSFAWSMVFGGIAVVYSVRIVYTKLMYGAPAGFPSLMIVQLIGFTFVFLFIGILGEYLNALMKQLVVKKPFVYVDESFSNEKEVQTKSLMRHAEDTARAGSWIWITDRSMRFGWDLAVALKAKLSRPGYAVTIWKVEDAASMVEGRSAVVPALLVAKHVLAHGGAFVFVGTDSPFVNIGDGQLDRAKFMEVVVEEEHDKGGDGCVQQNDSGAVCLDEASVLTVDPGQDGACIGRAVTRITGALTLRGMLGKRLDGC